MLPADSLDEEEREEDARELGQGCPQQVVVVTHLQRVALRGTGLPHLCQQPFYKNVYTNPMILSDQSEGVRP